MLCQICGKNTATLHFTQIVENKMSEYHLCEQCAEEKGFTEQVKPSKQKFDVAAVFADMMNSMTATDEERVGHVQCPRCGLLYSAFKETGRLGCAECYNAFQFQLRPLLRRIHGDTRHKGKTPARDGERVSIARQVQRLYDELQRAVAREEFERAAEVRDEIHRLEEQEKAAKPEPKA
jgi:protein arginine kinase activator